MELSERSERCAEVGRPGTEESGHGSNRAPTSTRTARRVGGDVRQTSSLLDGGLLAKCHRRTVALVLAAYEVLALTSWFHPGVVMAPYDCLGAKKGVINLPDFFALCAGHDSAARGCRWQNRPAPASDTKRANKREDRKDANSRFEDARPPPGNVVTWRRGHPGGSHARSEVREFWEPSEPYRAVQAHFNV